MAKFEVNTDQRDTTAHIALSGELDISTAERLEEEIARVESAAPAVILLDLRAVEFMDSSGLRVIVSADGRAREQSRRLAVIRGPEAVQRVFEVTRLDERLEILDDPPGVTAPDG